MGRGPVIAVLAFCVVVALAAWVRLGLPVMIPDAPVTRAQCVSYAPFRDGETPFDQTLVISEDRIREDLTLLSGFTNCVRTYASTNGLGGVPAVAESLGMTVLQGLWIGREADENRAEMDRVIALANAHPQTIRAVIVGNEVLLRREQPVDRLAAMIAEVRAAVPVPVTYADVWEFWLQAPHLAESVDFLTIHILPYWEDDPVAVEAAIRHVSDIHDKMAAAFPGKDIMIGETGWPSAGRQREGAEPSLVNATHFTRGILAAAEKGGWSYNLIEAFDQPWKRALEGTAGGAWGLFGVGGVEKVTLSGPVSEVPDHAAGITSMLANSLVIILTAQWLMGWKLDWPARLVTGLGGVAAGGALSFFTEHMVNASRTPVEWAINGGLWVLAATLAILVLAVLAEPQARGVGRGLIWVRKVMLAAAAISVVGMTFDARYRDFPSSLWVIAAVGLVLLRLRWKGDDLIARGREEGWLAAVVLIGALLTPFREGWANDDALAWAVVMAAFALSLLPARRGAAVPNAPAR